MSTDITLHRPASSELSLADEQTEWTEKQKYALGLGKGVTNADLAIYFHVCKRTGLDPFARQIYMLERWSKDGPKQTIQTGIDGYRLIAKRAAGAIGYGYGVTEWCGSDGVWRDVWLSSVPPAAARMTVTWRGNEYPATALYSEYVQTVKSGEPNSMWKRMPANQLAKCAEALALRKAFPQDLSGIYTEDEMGQAENYDAPAPTAKPRGMDAVRQAVAPPVVEQPAEDVQDADVVDEETGEIPLISDGQRKAMFAAFTKAGFATDARSEEGRTARLEYIALVVGHTIETSNDLTAAEASKVIDALAQDAAESGEQG